MKKLIAVHVVVAFFDGVKREIAPGSPLPEGLDPEALDDLLRLKAVEEIDITPKTDTEATDAVVDIAGAGTLDSAVLNLPADFPDAGVASLGDAVAAGGTSEASLEPGPGEVGETSAPDGAAPAQKAEEKAPGRRRPKA